MNWGRILYILIFIFSIGFFLRNAYRLLANVCLGQWDNRFDRLTLRLKNMLVYAFGQLRVVKIRYGINHFVIFWGFMTLLMLNGEFLIAGLFPQFSWAFLGTFLYGLLLVMTEIMSAAVLIAVAIAVVRRVFFRPKHIEATFDAFLILGMIAALMIAYFGYHAGEIALGESEWGRCMFISNALSSLFSTASHSAANFFWWIHALVLLTFMNYLPYSKHLHVLTAIPNCFFRSFDYPKTLPTMEFVRGNDFGISKITQFTWKDLLDFMSCTECGRCQAECPANNTGKSLNPRLIIHQGKINLFNNSPALLAARPKDTLGPAPDDAEMAYPLIGEGELSIAENDLWACTTCGSCMTQCPVFIEHVPKIIEMRRHLVMEQSKFPHELISFFENSEQRFNPWGIAPTDRAKWTTDLNVPIVQEGKPVEYLFFVGCAGAYDSRVKSVVADIAKIFNKAGISWGILGQEERCCGDSLRRLGNEFVFERMARDNIERFHRFGVTKIVTHCPHGYSTIKNDYKQFGGDFEVYHHSELIEKLIADGKISLKPKQDGKIVYHDSCYLGRYNNIYDSPRHLIEKASGSAPVEMDRCGEKSFCCGAGGGGMWMEEMEGTHIYLERTGEALKKDPSTIAVACPFCMTMFEDGVKDNKVQEKVKVKDIAEIVAAALE